MKASIKRLWREPLMHFMLIGVAVFLFYGLTREQGSEAPKHIVVNSSQQEQILANFKRTWMRPPTEDERAALIENHVRDEVFYREALAMGLDQNDPIVRRRMRLKLEFLLEDLSANDVTDTQLTEFLHQNPERFRRQPQVSFQQVFLNPDKRKTPDTDAKQLRVRLNSGISPESVGDPTLLPFDYSLATRGEIARTFGERFANEVIKLAPGEWTGPVYSTYGAHLLKISESIEARQPELAEIRELVTREYRVQRRKEQKELAYQQLRESYEVTIEPLQSAQESTAGTVAAVQADEAQ